MGGFWDPLAGRNPQFEKLCSKLYLDFPEMVICGVVSDVLILIFQKC